MKAICITELELRMSLRIEYVGAAWCKVCGVVKPGVENLAKSFGVELALLDLDEMENNEHIKKVPTLLVYKGEDLVQTIVTKHIDALQKLLTDECSSLKTTDDF